MSLVQTIDETEYPESDGKPMGETDWHIEWMIRIRDILKHRYADQQVYVGTDLLVYYREGDPSKFIVPDDFIVKDCDPRRRRTFKIWQEGRRPNVVFEVTSRSSRDEDQMYKPQIYARLTVPEYFLYDPTGEYLDPPLQGFRLTDSDYVAIEADRAGMLRCAELGILLHLEDGNLVMRDERTQDVLMTRADAEAAARKAEENARKAEENARKAAELALQAAQAKAQQLESEMERLKSELARKTGNS